MKLTKAEKTIAIIFVVALILGVGIFVLIYPQYTNIGKNQKSLDSKKKEYATLVQTLERESTINDEIKTAYNAAKDLSDCFYQDMTTYEADVTARALMADINKTIETLSVSPFSTSSLSVSFYDSIDVTYPLKEYSKAEIVMPDAQTVPTDDGANSAAAENTDTEAPAEETQLTEEELRNKLATSETVGSIDVSFEITTDTKGLLEFMDYIAALPKATYFPSASVQYTIADAKDDGTTDNGLKAGEFITTVTLSLYCVQPMQEPVF